MDLSRFLNLPQTDDGRKVITLMADPSMTDPAGAPSGFMSLVDKGANLRRFQVVKAEDLTGGNEPTDLPANPSQGWFQRFLGSIFGAVATKGEDKPTTFDGAILRERLHRARWEATDALWDVIGGVMSSDGIADKPAAVRVALEQFSAHVSGLVTATVALKAEDRSQALGGLELTPEVARKAGRVISAVNLATLESTRTQLEEALAALASLLERAQSKPEPTTKADPGLEDHDMRTPEQITAIADAAATSAIKAAKAAGLTDAAKLAQVGIEAQAQVYKAAVSGPAQPAMPANELARQMGESGGMGGAMSDPHGEISAALAKVSGLATKIEAMEGKVSALHGKLEGDGDKDPGIMGVLERVVDGVTAMASKVAKLEGTPTAPRGATDPEILTETVIKREAGTWKDSALTFTG